MLRNLVAFMNDVLGMPRSAANGGVIEMIRRSASNRFCPFEILVTFKEISTRDTVIGSSAKLADMHDKATRRSTAGIRMDAPCLLYTSPSPRDGLLSRMPSSA